MENDEMSYLKETAAWEDGIYQIDTSDPRYWVDQAVLTTSSRVNWLIILPG